MIRRRRRCESEIAFGSDSFLDVVTNVVGIVIILIVIVGVRVKNAPASSVTENDAALASERTVLFEEWSQQRSEIEEENSRRRAAYEAAIRSNEIELKRRRERDQALSQRRQEAAVARATRLRAIESIQAKTDAIEAEAASLQSEIDGLAMQLEIALEQGRQQEQQRIAVRQATEAKRIDLDRMRQENALLTKLVGNLKAEWNDLELRMAALRESWSALQTSREPPKEWRHVLTPIAHRIRTREIHFRCLAGRIANTHHEDLLELVRQKFVSSRGEPAKSEDIVGPIGGFRLRYVVGRSSGSFSQLATDPFSSGYILSAWQLLADSEQLGETAEQATGRTSRLLTALARYAPNDYAVTLWVYPDSFSLAKAIETRLHELGFSVAMRPLPFGVPIAGSVFGTASRGQ